MNVGVRVTRSVYVRGRRQMCLGAQHADPRSNYEFYLRKQRLDWEEWDRRRLPPPPRDPRLAVVEETPEQPVDRWTYEPHTKLSIGDPQMEWITKSRLEPGGGFPQRLLHLADSLDGDRVDALVQSTIRECYVFDTKAYERTVKVRADPADPWNPHTVSNTLHHPEEPRMAFNILSNLALHANQFISSRAPRRRRTKRMLVPRVNTQSMYTRLHKYPLLLRQSCALNLLSTSPLPVVDPDPSVTSSHAFQDFSPLVPVLDLTRTRRYFGYESFGVTNPSSRSRYFPHTALLPPAHAPFSGKRAQSATAAAAAPAFVAFSHALAKARERFGPDPVDRLESPIVAQAIASSGFDLTFATVQLNTTDFSTDSGVKNQVWLAHNVPLFSRVLRQFDMSVQGYNPEAGRILLAHLVNGGTQLEH